MKKLLGIFILGLLLSGNVYAKNTKLVKGNFYHDEIKWRNLVYKLPDGKWEFFHKNHFSVSTIKLNCIEFIQVENKTWKGGYSVCEIRNGGQHAATLGTHLVQALKKGKYDNCTLRPEYFYAKLWIRGMSMNCFKTRHIDVDKELNYPDDRETETFYMRKYIKDNNLKIPKTSLSTLSLFFAPSIRDKGIEISHIINPELYGESFNIGTGNKTTIKDLALTIKKIYKIKKTPIFSNMSKRSWDLNEWYSDSKKAEKILGWKSKTSLADGLNLTFDWLSTLTKKDFISITKKNSSNTKRSISAIIACYKDEMAIPIMYQRLTNTFKEIKIDYEIIFVCDGSPHNDIDVVKKISKNDTRVIGINHSRNFGSQMAFRSGMELSTKQAVVLLDGDLQDPPELIKDFVKKWLEGNDVVYGTRVKREMPFYWGFMYKAFYRILSLLSFIKIPVDAGDFSLLDKRVVSWILKCPERDLFMRGIRAFVGFKQVGVDYVRPARMFGNSTNSLFDLIGWAKMGILSFTNIPLNLMTIMGFATLIISIILILLFILLKIFFPDIAPKGATTIMLLILSFGSINLFAISLVGEYIGKIILEVKQRPRVIRSEIIRSGVTTEL